MNKDANKLPALGQFRGASYPLVQHFSILQRIINFCQMCYICTKSVSNIWWCVTLIITLKQMSETTREMDKAFIFPYNHQSDWGKCLLDIYVKVLLYWTPLKTFYKFQHTRFIKKVTSTKNNERKIYTLPSWKNGRYVLYLANTNRIKSFTKLKLKEKVLNTKEETVFFCNMARVQV